MKVLVVGRGGREHTLIWKISQSKLVTKVYCAPGNAGIQELSECIPIEENNFIELAKFAKDNAIDLVVIGPEEPLVKGLAEVFQTKGIKVFGPSKYAALLEGSKIFSKKIMTAAKVKSADYAVFENPIRAMVYAKKIGKCVVKADGLAAGKGVFICSEAKEAVAAIKKIMINQEFGVAGNKIIIEDLLEGEEASILAFSDGKNVKLMVSSQDHKRALDDDKGLNTGGMGAYSPAPVATKEVERRALKEVMIPVVNEMAKRGIPYVGVLYAGLMIKGKDINILEFNVRFGDPECQVVLPRLDSDLVKIMLACIDGKLDKTPIKWSKKSATCVVMASGGYPGKYGKGNEIKGLLEAKKIKDSVVFHAGTNYVNGKVVTNGGRVLGVTALSDTVRGSITKAYKTVNLIKFKDMHYRKDIGKNALRRLRCKKKK